MTSPKGMFSQGLKEIRRDQKRMEKERERQKEREKRMKEADYKISKEMERLGYGRKS